MPNLTPTPAVIAEKALEYLFTDSGVLQSVNLDYKSEFTMTKERIGKTVQVETPTRHTLQDGPVITSVQPINTGLVPFSVDKWKTLPVKVTGMEKTFTNIKALDSWAEKEVRPFIAPFKAAVEESIFGLYWKVANHVGTPGTGPTTGGPLASAATKLALALTPQEQRNCFLHPVGSEKLFTGLSTTSNLFNPQKEVGEQFKSGVIMPEVAGFKMRQSPFIANHVVGSAAGTILTDGVTQSGEVINTDGLTSTTGFKKGDVITFGAGATGVYAVNPITKKSTGQLRQFTVMADSVVSTATTDDIPLTLSPPVIVSGPFQNVTGATADLTVGIPDGVAVNPIAGTVSTAYAQNLAWWKPAIGLVCVPIEPLEGLKSVTKEFGGLSITFSSQGDIMNFETIKRLDMAFGVDIFPAYQDCIARISN